MYKFAMEGRIPIGGRFFYVIPETQLYVSAPTRMGFLNDLSRAYDNAGLKMPENIWDIAQDYMCRMIPEGFCIGDDDGKPRAKVFTIQTVRDNTREVVEQGDCKETQAIAGKRAETCVECPMHDRASCSSCSGLATWVTRLLGRSFTGHKISADWLGVCRVDGCMAHAKIFARKLKKNDAYPTTCWAVQKGEGVELYG